MLKEILFFIFLFSFFSSVGEASNFNFAESVPAPVPATIPAPVPSDFENSSNTEQKKESGYKYNIRNYFSKVYSSEGYTYSRHFTFYSAVSFYRESTDKPFKPFSAFAFGFNQKVKEIPYLADVSLQFSVFSLQLKKRRSVLLEITPRISFPEVKTTFPLYMGLGAGFGFYPRYIIRKMSYLSANGQFFVGLRLHELYHNLGFSAEVNLKIHSAFNESAIYLDLLGQMGLIFGF